MQNAQEEKNVPLPSISLAKPKNGLKKEPQETYFFLFLSQQERQNEIMEKILLFLVFSSKVFFLLLTRSLWLETVLLLLLTL